MDWETKEGLQDLAEVQAGRRMVASKAIAAGMSVQEYLHQKNQKRRMRVLADAIRLKYWPALYTTGCDPVAFAIAERVMARRAGGFWGEVALDGSRCRGGWDSYGSHGLSGSDVRAMWIAAGCRDSEKFRAQVAAGIVARKGDTLPWLRDYIRGSRWLERNRIWFRHYLARKAVAALGRLSPELRRAALDKFFGDTQLPSVIRIRDLDWDAAKRAQSAIRGGSVRARAALAGDRRACELLGVASGGLSAELAPAFPGVPLAFARRVALGESPAQIAGGTLTKREAHAWAMDGAPSDLPRWLAGHLGLPAARSIRVVRWLQHCRQSGRWSAVERERIARVPGEDRARAYSLLSVLDEVQDEDIETGRDSVDAVLQRTAQRLGEAWLSAQMADHRMLAPMPAWARKLPRGVRILRTPADLAREGQEMSHCVGGYRHAVERGQCTILAIATRYGRSTVELRPDLSVVQHFGSGNGPAPGRNKTILRALIARITKQENRYAAA